MTVVAQPTRQGTILRSVRTRIVDWVPAIVVFFAAIAAWQLSIEIFDIQRFLLPKPWAIVSAFWTQRGDLWSAGWLTLKEALGGFVIGSALGIAFALVLARFRRLGEALMPIAIAANAIPIIAFSPDLQRLVRSPVADAANGDGGSPLLLPGHGQHAARPDVGAPLANRADAVLCSRRIRDLPARPRSRRHCRSSLRH